MPKDFRLYIDDIAHWKEPVKKLLEKATETDDREVV